MKVTKRNALCAIAAALVAAVAGILVQLTPAPAVADWQLEVTPSVVPSTNTGCTIPGNGSDHYPGDPIAGCP